MYDENEILVTTINIGKKEKGNLIPKGTEVEFIKVVDGSQLGQSLIAFRYNNKVLVTKEANVRPKKKRKIKKAFNEFQMTLMKDNPRLRRYHPNLILRAFYRLRYFITDFFEKEKDENI